MQDLGVVADELPKAVRFTRERYERMVEADVFGPEDHIELLDGEIVQMAPQKSLHATATALFQQELGAALGTTFHVRMQLPLALSDDSEPEPDIAVVRGAILDYRDAHPSIAELIVEVSDTTLAYDRGRKRAAYARAGVPEYWIANTRARRLEVHRVPVNGHYTERFEVATDETVSPLVEPSCVLRVADLLP